MSEDLKEERQPVLDELLEVLVDVDGAKISEEALDDGLAMEAAGRGQGLQPAVEGPGHPQATQLHRQLQVTVLTAVIHRLLDEGSRQLYL